MVGNQREKEDMNVGFSRNQRRIYRVREMTGLVNGLME